MRLLANRPLAFYSHETPVDSDSFVAVEGDTRPLFFELFFLLVLLLFFSLPPFDDRVEAVAQFPLSALVIESEKVRRFNGKR